MRTCFARGIPAAAFVFVSILSIVASARAVSASTLSTVYTFNSYCDGWRPAGSLLYATDGNYYGVTGSGGTNSEGTVYRLSPSGTLTTLHSFTDTGSDGYSPVGHLVEAPNGLMYGVTTYGGTSGVGTVFSVNPTSGVFSDVASFTSASGAPYNPTGGLVSDSSGNLYGTMESGGADSAGGIYKIKSNGTGFSSLHSFAAGGSDGGYSNIPLVLDGSTLYGLGSYQYGVIYSITTAGGSFETIYSFVTTGSDGYYANGLLLGADGNLYITAQYGGSGYGVIDSMATTASSPTAIYDFTATSNGYYPIGSLVQDSSGALLGATQYGGVDSSGKAGNGVLFSVSTSGSGFQALATLPNNESDGGNPISGVTLGPSGTVAAACSQDPENESFGEIVTANTTGGGLSVLHDFYAQGTFSGERPYYGGLTYAGGNYYGTTSASIGHGNGTIFEMTPSHNVSFPYYFGTSGSYDAASPYTSPVVGFDGQLVGSSYGGGIYGTGALYQFNYNTLGETSLFDFSGSGGAYSESNVVLGSDGNYYFTTEYGGDYDKGAIVEVPPDGLQESVVYSFTGGDDGYTPYGNIVGIKSGTIYGTCQSGGTNSAGVLWSWSAASGIGVVYSFDDSTDGRNPNGVILGQDGRLYGTCYQSSSNYGIVYSEAKSGGAVDILHSFSYSSDGGYPVTAPSQGSTGLIYGTCSQGGISNYGTVWQVGTGGGNSFAVLGSFADDNATTGGYPYGQVSEGQDGDLYGTTLYGGIEPFPGTTVDGSIYEVNVSIPVIDSIVDSVTGGPSGLGGDAVTITGANLAKVTAVRFNGAAVSSFTIVSPTEITTTVPNTASTGQVTATTTSQGTATSSEIFVITPPTISSVSEVSGLAGDTVTVTGTNFVNVLSVAFGGVSASYTVVSPEEITTTAPVNGKDGPIRVVTEGGTAVSKVFTYRKPGITSFTPTSGPVGTSVKITGSNFAGVSTVTFNGTTATTFTVNSTTSITATVPTGATTGPIAVTTTGGTKTTTAVFTVN